MWGSCTSWTLPFQSPPLPFQYLTAECIVAPRLLLLSGSRQAFFIGAAAWAAMTVTYSTMVRYYRLNPAWALAMPLAALFYLGATMHSAVKYWNGRGGDWKGRVQDVQDPHIIENPLC